MTVRRGFLITILSGIAFAIVGGLLGSTIGRVAPDYYRTVFRIPPEIDLDPVQTGLGLGITQGLTAGLIVGLVIVMSVAWYESRQLHVAERRDADIQ